MKQGRCNTPLTHQPGDTEETVHLRWRQRRKRSIAHASSAPQRGQGHALFLSECHMSRVTPNFLIVKQLGVTRYIITYVKSILIPVPCGFMRGDGEARPLLEEIERMGDQQPHFRACIKHPGQDLSQICPPMRQETRIGMEFVVFGFPTGDEIERRQLWRFPDDVQRLTCDSQRLGKGRNGRSLRGLGGLDLFGRGGLFGRSGCSSCWGWSGRPGRSFRLLHGWGNFSFLWGEGKYRGKNYFVW